jgi:hypothetical protein
MSREPVSNHVEMDAADERGWRRGASLGASLANPPLVVGSARESREKAVDGGRLAEAPRPRYVRGLNDLRNRSVNELAAGGSGTAVTRL